MSDGDAADVMLRDLSPEEMAEGMTNSCRYVSRVFLEKKHYQKIHQRMSSRWNRFNSLSAAVKLMQSYGVELTKEEAADLENLSEAEQINTLVGKMPAQSNDQFQNFFVKLQLLVSTAMRVRQSLEQGKSDDVEEALDHADTLGIGPYIIDVAIVQAGTEVKTLKDQFTTWCNEADNKMARLLRGQQDNLTAQKQLAVAEADLARQNCEQSQKSAKVVLTFASDNDKAIKLLSFQGWAQTTKELRLEAKLQEEYGPRLKDLEDNLAQWKQDQMMKSENILLRKIMADNTALLGRLFDFWRKDVEETKFVKENEDRIKALDEKLATAKATQRDNAQKVMASLAGSNTRGLMDMVLKAWIEVREDSLKAKEQMEIRQTGDTKLDQFAKHKSAEAKFIIESFAGESSTGLMTSVFNAWVGEWWERRKEEELAEAMAKSQSKLSSLTGRTKAASGSLMNRAAEHVKTMQVLRVFNAWKAHSRLERVTQQHTNKIAQKREQLAGVQRLFREFAQKLQDAEGSMKAQAGGGGSDHNAQLFDSHRHRRMKGSHSLPDINQKPGAGGGSASRGPAPPPTGSPGKSPVKVRQPGSNRSSGQTSIDAQTTPKVQF